MTGTQAVHHATIMVTDLEKAHAFYGGVLELPRIARPDFPSSGIWYEVDGVQIHLILTDQADPPSPRHIAFAVANLDSVLDRVAELGLRIWDDIPIEGWVRKHCSDPFGNGIELLQRVV
ncbi:MAG: hypothetical protein HOH43_06460 [Candidatus Latescibacteria bacterium]|jgi:glyoxylase I family protein|nr:hypothetical protein [Candidatus Latescibacterota bacterium]